MDIHSSIVHVDLNKAKSTFEESVNRFLSSKKGLQYLLLKFPHLSLLDALKEYKYLEQKSLCY